MLRPSFDVLVVGGGLVGANLACTLASSSYTSSLRIGIIESSASFDPPRSPIPDLRVSSVNPSSARLLESIGVWDKLPTDRITPFHSMRVWDSVGNGTMRFDDHGGAMGFIIENNAIQSALFNRMNELGVDIIAPASVKSIKRSNWISARLEDGKELTARLIVGADGGKSMVRSEINHGNDSGGYGWSYNQRGVVSVVKHPDGFHSSTAYQRFLPDGPIALLPLFDNYSSIVWSTTVPHSEYLLALDDQSFADQVNDAFTKTIERSFHFTLPFSSTTSVIDVPPILGVAGKRGAFPLRTEHSGKYVAERMALIGDAAHVIHPLAGQGLNLGIADVVTLTKSMQEAIETGSEIGSLQALNRYERNRRLSNNIMLAAVDSLHRLFTVQPLPIVFLRNIGLSMVDSMSMLKRSFVKLASHGEDISTLGSRKI